MKNIVLSAAALFSCVAQADVALQLNFEHKKADSVRTRSLEFVVAYDETMQFEVENLNVTVTVHVQDDGQIVLCFAIVYHHDDGSSELVAEPVIRTEYNKEALVTLENDDNHELLTLKVIAVPQVAA